MNSDTSLQAPNIFHRLVKHKPHIGLRKIKTLLSVLIGFLLWQVIRIFFPELEVHPALLYVYAILETRETSDKTVTLGKKRILTTLVSVPLCLGILALGTWVRSFSPSGCVDTLIEITVLLFGILLMLVVGESLDLNCPVACAVCVAMVSRYFNDGRYLYAILRSSYTIIAVFSAWLVNVKLFPYHGAKEA